ncbi:unnamed protein product [Citrullus colocynthis]|uniref:Uncharacterized protein n=1 Tax=Citrullus colocynthis TaxID=252529 RepID=A0ABP0YYD2_9ROSI
MNFLPKLYKLSFVVTLNSSMYVLRDGLIFLELDGMIRTKRLRDQQIQLSLYQLLISSSQTSLSSPTISGRIYKWNKVKFITIRSTHLCGQTSLFDTVRNMKIQNKYYACIEFLTVFCPVQMGSLICKRMKEYTNKQIQRTQRVGFLIKGAKD